MTEGNTDLQILDANSLSSPLSELHFQLERFILELGLPVENVIAPLDDRQIIVSQLENTIQILPLSERSKSHYLSKFTVAVAAGLFDGAINYLWNETIMALRTQVIRFDLQYFYNILSDISARYKNLKNSSDLSNVSEHDLLEGCRRIGLLSDINYHRLEHINYMRNHASAAHPNDNELDPYEILSWLSNCLKYAITAEPDLPVVNLRQLLQNIKRNEIPPEDFEAISTDLIRQPQERIDDVLSTLFDYYIDSNSSQTTRNNVEGIAPLIWDAATENRKYKIGARYGTFRKSGDVLKKDSCHRFLEVVDGVGYKDEDSIAGEMLEKLENLHRAHYSMNNFYNEYPHAKSLSESLPKSGKIPRAAITMWVKTNSICFIGNGMGYREGVDEAALPYYERAIDNFTESEAIEFVKLFYDAEFANPLNLEKPDERVRKIAKRLKEKHSNAYLVRVLDLILKAPRKTLRNFANTSEYQSAMQSLVK